MKKILLLLSCILFVSNVIAQSNKNNAEAFIKAISAEKYEDAVKYFDPAITQISPQVLSTGWQQINTMFGGFESYFIPEETVENTTPIVVGVRFKSGTKGFACNFNDKHQMVGFFVVPPPDDKQAVKKVSISKFNEENISIPVNGGHIKGTLMLPSTNTALTPVVIIIAGSGPTDRNGNQDNDYKLLAEGLAENGFASLRYDKRFIGESNDFKSNPAGMKFDDMVQDAKTLVEYLHRQKAYKEVSIIGHSEGSLVGMLAAQKADVANYVSLCGAGENIAKTLKRQIPNEQAATIIDQLLQGKQVKEIPTDLQMIFTPSVQPFLISWMKYEPANEIKKLKMPVLILEGSTDFQVLVADAEMLHKAAPKSELKIIEGMNHILKDAPADKVGNYAIYNQPDLPVSKDLITTITHFLSVK